MKSKLDHIFRRILLTKFFTKGWGEPENLRQIFAFRKLLAKRENAVKFIDPDHPVNVTKVRKYKALLIEE